MPGDIAQEDDIDAVGSPALVARQLARRPFGEGADTRDADFAAFEVGDRFHRPVRTGDQHQPVRPTGIGRDSDDRRSLGDGRHFRPTAEADIDRVGDEGLLLLRGAGKGDDFDIDAVPLEEAFRHADIGRGEIDRLGLGFADTQRLIGTGRKRRDPEKRNRGDGGPLQQHPLHRQLLTVVLGRNFSV